MVNECAPPELLEEGESKKEPLLGRNRGAAAQQTNAGGVGYILADLN